MCETRVSSSEVDGVRAWNHPGAVRPFPYARAMPVSKGGIIVPVSAKGVELRKKFSCLICGMEFHQDEANAYQRHVARCAHQHESDLREMSPRERLPGIYGDQVGDPEFEAWVRANGRIK